MTDPAVDKYTGHLDSQGRRWGSPRGDPREYEAKSRGVKQCSIPFCLNLIEGTAGSYCLEHDSQVKRFKAPEVRRAELHGRSLSILNHRKGGLEDQQYIYLLEFELWIKLGRTGDPSRRFREHVKIAGEIVEVLHLEWLSEPKLMEDYLREQAKKAGIHCRGREWYPRSSKHFFVQLLRPTPTG